MAKEITSAPVTIYSVLASGVIITGDVSTDTDLRLDGIMDGNLVCGGKVIVGPAAKIKGDITCVNAEISGIVIGNVIAPEQLCLKGQSRIDGAVRTSTLIIEAGAVLNGSVTMESRNG